MFENVNCKVVKQIGIANARRALNFLIIAL